MNEIRIKPKVELHFIGVILTLIAIKDVKKSRIWYYIISYFVQIINRRSSCRSLLTCMYS